MSLFNRPSVQKEVFEPESRKAYVSTTSDLPTAFTLIGTISRSVTGSFGYQVCVTSLRSRYLPFHVPLFYFPSQMTSHHHYHDIIQDYLRVQKSRMLSTASIHLAETILRAGTDEMTNCKTVHTKWFIVHQRFSFLKGKLPKPFTT